MYFFLGSGPQQLNPPKTMVVSQDAVESLLEQTVLNHQFSNVPGGTNTDNLEEENQSETSLGAMHRCLC